MKLSMDDNLANYKQEILLLSHFSDFVNYRGRFTGLEYASDGFIIVYLHNFPAETKCYHDLRPRIKLIVQMNFLSNFTKYLYKRC